MIDVVRFDALARLGTAKRMDNGWLEVDAVITRTGVFRYRNPDGTPRLEYRPPEEVGRADALASFELTPVTDDHPDTVYPARPQDNGLLAAANTSAYSRGTVAAVRKDGDYVRARLRVTDAKTIAKMDAGKVATSCGYRCEYDPTPGVTPDGARYDGVQRNIRGNHVAIVDVGRAGPEARVRMDAAGHAIDVPECLTDRGGDATLRSTHAIPVPGDAMTDAEKLELAAKEAVARADKAEADMRSVVARADKAEAAVEELKLEVAKLSATRSDTEVAKDLQTRLDTAVAELATAKASLQTATDPARFAAAVQRRTKIEGAARKILGETFRCDGTDRAIMLSVVEKVSGAVDAARSDEYVESRFDHAVEGHARGEAALAKVRTMVAPAARTDVAPPDTRSARDKMIANMHTLAPVSAAK